MYQHLSPCEHYNDIVNLRKLPDTDSTAVIVDKKEYIVMLFYQIFECAQL